MKQIITFCIAMLYIFAHAQTQVGQDIFGDSSDDSFGVSVDISADGNILVIGSGSSSFQGTNGAGKVRVYQFNGSQWIQLGSDIFGSELNEVFGISVSISSDGMRIAGSARFNDEAGTDAGKVRIFEYDGSDWVQLGNSLLGEEQGDQFGQAISLSADGTRIAVASPFSNGDGADTGVSRVFEFDGTTWNQLGEDIVGETPNDELGRHSIALSSDGSTVASSSGSNDQGGSNTGNVLVHRFDGTEWVQQGDDIDGTSTQDGNLGIYVALSSDGNRVAIGAPGNRDNFAENGQVRVFELVNDEWVQLGSNLYGEASFDRFGSAVSLSNNGEYLSVCSTIGDTSLPGETTILKYSNGDWVEVTTIDGDEGSFNAMTFNESGDYVVIGSREYNSTGRVRVFSLSEVLSSHEVVDVNGISVYPNPTQGVVTVATPLLIQKVQLYSSHGISVPVSLVDNTIDVGNLPNGIYLLKIKTEKGMLTQKIIINK